ncbi:MAG: hypothetical protein HFE82_06385 [Erysipelotrichaceae bacterium]|nr:hypothetical protein [Erysipelotrichaceae bacterium]
MDNIKQITDIAEIIIALTSLFALMISSFALWHSRASTVREFFVQGDSEEMKKYRQVIYDIYNQYTDKDIILKEMDKHSQDISQVVSFYDVWALMVKKRYLPFWTFSDSSRYTAINVFNKIKPYIEVRRGHKTVPDSKGNKNCRYCYEKGCGICQSDNSQEKRKHGNQENYASHFEWLVKKLVANKRKTYTKIVVLAVIAQLCLSIILHELLEFSYIENRQVKDIGFLGDTWFTVMLLIVLLIIMVCCAVLAVKIYSKYNREKDIYILD